MKSKEMTKRTNTIKPQGTMWWLEELKRIDHKEQGDDQKN
jgi:hypothetical protein